MRLSAALSAAVLAGLLAGQADAGGFGPAIVESEPVVVVEPEPRRSSYGILLPLLLVGGLVATASSNDKS